MKAGTVVKTDDPQYGRIIDVTLACGHLIKLKGVHVPEPGKLVWCMRCSGYSHRPFPLEKDVDGKVIPGEWHWRCFGHRCGGPKKHGSSRTNAVYAASRHSRGRSDHEIWVIDPAGRVVERWGGSLDDAGKPKFVNGVAVWPAADREARIRYKMDEDVPPF